MKIIEPYFEILNMADGDEICRLLELAARTCYKSEDKIAEGTSRRLLSRLLKTGHESVIEHASVSVKIVCDRGISHEIVRHRLCSFSQESTRYANYSREKFGNEITVIRPFFWNVESDKYTEWIKAMKSCEMAYLTLLEMGAKAQEARSVLPNSLKTELIVSANVREWRHIFKLRCSNASHPQMRQVMLPMLKEFHSRIPVLFDALYEEYKNEFLKFTV